MAEIIHRQDPNYVDLNEPTNYNTTWFFYFLIY
jgi:hypothetical protein